jgi:hypothetical protein
MKPDPLAAKLAAAFLSYLLQKHSVDDCLKLLPDPLPPYWCNLAKELEALTEEAKKLISKFPQKNKNNS